MSSGGDNAETDIKLFVKAVQDQFKLLNMRLDNLESLSNPRSSRKHMVRRRKRRNFIMMRVILGRVQRLFPNKIAIWVVLR